MSLKTCVFWGCWTKCCHTSTTIVHSVLNGFWRPLKSPNALRNGVPLGSHWTQCARWTTGCFRWFSAGYFSCLFPTMLLCAQTCFNKCKFREPLRTNVAVRDRLCIMCFRIFRDSMESQFQKVVGMAKGRQYIASRDMPFSWPKFTPLSIVTLGSGISMCFCAASSSMFDLDSPLPYPLRRHAEIGFWFPSFSTDINGESEMLLYFSAHLT